MELNLRKARKLEQKIQAYVEKMQLKSSINVRVMADAASRQETLQQGRIEFLSDGQRQKELIQTRFAIRQLIGQINEGIGINSLMNKREELQELLKRVSSGVDVLNLAEVEDDVAASKVQIEQGKESYGRRGTVVAAPVSTKEDLELFKNEEAEIKRQLEDVEDQLSQKNLGAKLTLSDDAVALLKSCGLI